MNSVFLRRFTHLFAFVGFFSSSCSARFAKFNGSINEIRIKMSEEESGFVFLFFGQRAEGSLRLERECDIEVVFSSSNS